MNQSGASLPDHSPSDGGEEEIPLKKRKRSQKKRIVRGSLEDQSPSGNLLLKE